MKSQITKNKKQLTTAIAVCIILLSPLFWRGVGGEVLAQGAGNCLSFDGVNDYVGFSPSGLLNTTYTYSLWVNASSIPTSGSASGLLEIGDNTFDQAVILTNNYAGIYTGWLFVSYNTDGTRQIITTGSLPTTNSWYHLAAVRDNSNVKMYQNGVLINTISTGGKTAGFGTSPVAEIRRTGNSYFNGQIDEVSIWNRALSETEIRNNMCKKLTGSESGLVGYWRFDESSGGTAYDASPNGNDGTLY